MTGDGARTGGPDRVGRSVSVWRIIDADPAAIFDVLADPRQHPVIDGSGTVRGVRWPEGERLQLGSRFGATMRQGVPYVIRNRVVELEPDRRIAWRHVMGHRWRYQLEPVGGGTRVTETFDWSTARIPWVIERGGFPTSHPPAMAHTLARLDALVTTGSVPDDLDDPDEGGTPTTDGADG